ncbi:MAG: hypothetical protein EPN33_08665 [Acidobacteria bacterium]|nr:MAG: hypothetical protein EPN33_08665 [Acidobacteriota bacterium]
MKISLALGCALLLGMGVAAQAPAAVNPSLLVPPPVNWLAVTAPRPQQAQKPKKAAGPPGHHVFYVIPAYQVEYLKNVPPLTPHEKLVEMGQDVYDPMGLALAGAEVLVLEHNRSSGWCDYGKGWGGFGKCYGSALLDANLSGALGDWALPVWFHQDPRYFRLGTGSFLSRTAYALSRVFLTRSDRSGGTVFDSSQLLGTVTAGFISNLYYPKVDRGAGLTLSRIEIDLAGTAIFNLEAEFWEDIHSALFH